MAELLHITERSVWDAARTSGTYEMSTRGQSLAEVGFIHCSLRRQLPRVAEMLYAGTDPSRLVVLVIDSERLSVPVRWEPPVPDAGCGPGTEVFPHVYGPLPVEAVTREEPWEWEGSTGQT